MNKHKTATLVEMDLVAPEWDARKKIERLFATSHQVHLFAKK